MKEAQIIGKLLPTHPDILPILEEIREKFNIPPISPTDESLKILLEFDLEINWKAVHGEILERVKETDIFLDKTIRIYRLLKKAQAVTPDDWDFENISEKFKNEILALADLLIKQNKPLLDSIDNLYKELADHCLEYLLTGEAREIPQDWISTVEVMDNFGEIIIVAMAGQLADPDEIAELFKTKYINTFGKKRPKFTEEHVKTTDSLRMKWEGKSTTFLLEEEDIRNGKEPSDMKSNRQTAATR